MKKRNENASGVSQRPSASVGRLGGEGGETVGESVGSAHHAKSLRCWISSNSSFNMNHKGRGRMDLQKTGNNVEHDPPNLQHTIMRNVTQ